MSLFLKPTVITLTAPTCAGKSHLLEEMLLSLDTVRVVSTTDRPARAGEVHGKHYHFISTEESIDLERRNQFAEFINYNGVRYGVTVKELKSKIDSGKTPVVIAEPVGLSVYKDFCKMQGWETFCVYVHADENVRFDRLVKRTVQDLAKISTQKFCAETVAKVITANNSRLRAMVEQERGWISQHHWDAIVTGEDTEGAIAAIRLGIEWANKRRI